MYTMICKLCFCALLIPSTLGFIVDTIFGSAPKTVEHFDIDKYLGRWYQVYASQSVMTLWESGAVCVTADYTNGTDAKPITVLNSENLNSPNGKLKEIRGYVTRTSEPGKNTVHLEGVPVGGDYWIIKLGPKTWGNGQYQYSVVSGSIRGQLFVLARDIAVFKRDFEAEVLQYLKDQGFTHFYNKPVRTYHGKDCVYNIKHQ